MCQSALCRQSCRGPSELEECCSAVSKEALLCRRAGPCCGCCHKRGTGQEAEMEGACSDDAGSCAIIDTRGPSGSTSGFEVGSQQVLVSHGDAMRPIVACRSSGRSVTNLHTLHHAEGDQSYSDFLCQVHAFDCFDVVCSAWTARSVQSARFHPPPLR